MIYDTLKAQQLVIGFPISNYHSYTHEQLIAQWKSCETECQHPMRDDDDDVKIADDIGGFNVALFLVKIDRTVSNLSLSLYIYFCDDWNARVKKIKNKMERFEAEKKLIGLRHLTTLTLKTSQAVSAMQQQWATSELISQ